jgi:hypothetical protein
MALAVGIMEEYRWGRKLDRCISALAPYGGAAREFLPRLRVVRQTQAAKDKNWEKNDEKRKKMQALDKFIAAIESDRRPPTLQTTQAFIQANAKR